METLLLYNHKNYSRTTIEFYFAESDKKRATRMLKSIFSLLDYPKPRKLIMDINIYNTLVFLNNHTIKRIPVF